MFVDSEGEQAVMSGDVFFWLCCMGRRVGEWGLFSIMSSWRESAM